MAQKDYVSRGQKKRPAAKKPTPPPLPWFKLFLALLLLLGFAFGIWHLTQSESSDPSLSSTPQKIESKSIDELDPLPVLEEEEWEFIEDLPEYQVKVDESVAPESERDYLMQCGSFREDSQAQELKANIAFAGLSSQVKASQGENGRWYRVILGPYDSKREAERDRHLLARQGINRCKIWIWNL